MKKLVNGLNDEMIHLKTLPYPNRGSLELQLNTLSFMNVDVMACAFQELPVTSESVLSGI